MTERELFDAIGRLPEQYRAEAFAPVQTPEQNDTNEIDAMFESAVRTEAVRPAAEAPRSTAEQKSVTRITKDVQQKPHRSGLIGLTAIAAAVALTVGGFAWKLRQEAFDPAANPGSSAALVQQSEISAEPVTALPENTTDSGISTGTTAASALVNTEDTRYNTLEPQPDTLADTEVNFLGGHGKLRIVENSSDLMLEDQDYWYLNGASRISRTETDARGMHAEESLCRDPGCAHQREDHCLQYCFEGRLLSDGQALYYNAGDDYEPGGPILERITSDGTTQPFFSLQAYPALWKTLEEKCNRQYPDAAPVNLKDQKLKWDIFNLTKLGNDDTYYMVLSTALSEAEQIYFNAGFLLHMKDGSFAMLPATLEKVQFDAENMVFCMTGDAMSFGNVVPAQQILLFDLKQITFSKDLFSEQAPTKTISMTQSWCLDSGKLFYYRVTGTERDAPGAPEMRNLCSYNLNNNFGLTNTTEELLEEHTEKTNLTAANGRLYYTVREAIGPDRICSCDPDGQNEETVFETDSIGYLFPVMDPGFVRFTTAGGFVILENGEVYPVKPNEDD